MEICFDRHAAAQEEDHRAPDAHVSSCPPEDAEEPDATELHAANPARLQMFGKSTSLRDDWLHRGERLQDMQLWQYARYIERHRRPRGGDAEALHRRVGELFLFATHYTPVQAHYVQVLRRIPHRVRVVGPNCSRTCVNQGEDNAQYKAVLFMPLHCPTPGACEDPLLCRPCLAHGPPGSFRFAPAWRARRAEIEVQADRAQAKKQKAKRIAVIRDTTMNRRVLCPQPEQPGRQLLQCSRACDRPSLPVHCHTFCVARRADASR